ncbi:hypothetical protein GCM10009799_45670 [Nocardiopsis rhodophaea]|uniref:BRCT domain-containing protein n=1 Tax=Nocardiopsis rhodophaea TaxID=280238 RepID=A0ABN2TK03_9ACTN
MADTWTAIDFETANHDRGSACAVGLVRVADGAVVDRYSTLIRPPRPVDFFTRHNTAVHGITAADVADAPHWPEVRDRILDFAAGGALVAHNAAFDISVLRGACAHTGQGWPPLDYACTLALARRTWRELPNHRLPTICAHIGHPVTRHHRADADAEAAARIAIAAMDHFGASTLRDLARAARLRLGRLEAEHPRAAPPDAPTAPGAAPPPAPHPAGAQDRFARWAEATRAPLPEPDPHADPAGPLFGRTVCVSGELDAMDKPEAWKRIAEAGGQPAKNVTRATGVLVIGAHDGPGTTSKHRRAEAYRARGQRIDIITETEFLTRLALARP